MSLNFKPTDVADFLSSLNAGVFEKQLGQVLSNVGHAAIEHKKKGKVAFFIEITPNNKSENTELVDIKYKIDFSEPTKRGTRKEDSELSQPMYVTIEGIKLFQSRPTPQLHGLNAPVIPIDTGISNSPSILDGVIKATEQHK